MRSLVTLATDQAILLRKLGPALAPTDSRNRKVSVIRLADRGSGLLHRNTLGQVSGFVDIAAAKDSNMVCQELQWNRRNDGLQEILHVGDLDDIVH